MRYAFCPTVVLLCLCSGCLSVARKVEQAARGSDRGERGGREERQRPRQVDLPQVEAVDLQGVSGHPRLFVGKQWPAATDDVGREWQAKLIKRADDALDAKPISSEPKKMLAAAREAVRRISLLAAVYRFTGDRKYADAGRRELSNVCRFETWQPKDFLATSEMMTAVSIGYDWMYDAMPAGERKAVVAALVRNGLQPAVDAYAANDAWPTMRNNWNLVCNGGTIVAALAVAEEEPDIARQALAGAMKSIPLGLALYDEHGGSAEGPMYHSYATRYLTFAAAALESATNSRASLTKLGRPGRKARSDAEGHELDWTNAGDFRIAMSGPSGKVANFGDCGEYLGNSAWMLWLANATGRPAYAAFQVDADRADPSAFDLLWYGSRKSNSAADVRPVATEFDAAVVLRENFTDPNAAFVAIRTGRTDASHSHLDLGNFVYDVLGERFACDLGADSYDLPGYLHNNRPDYLRTSTPGHNCLTRGDDSQPLAVGAKVTSTPTAKGQSVELDLSDAYPDARRAIRTFTLHGRVLTVTDTVRLDDRTTLNWHLHTQARVTITNGGAILESNAKHVELRVLEPANAVLTADPDETTPPQLPVQGVTQIRLRVHSVKDATIRVQLRPLDAR